MKTECLIMMVVVLSLLNTHYDFVLAFPSCRNSPTRARATSFTRFLDLTQWNTTGGRPPLEEGSASRRDLYLTTHKTHKRQTFMPPAGFKHAVPASDRPQTLTLDRLATGIRFVFQTFSFLFINWRICINMTQSKYFRVATPAGPYRPSCTAFEHTR
jgi:hypothetical protein